MAEPHDFPGANYHFGPPPGLEEMIGWLHVFSNGRCTVSAWKPDAELLAHLNAGGSIFTSHMTGSDENGKPYVFPTYVGTEEQVKAAVSDTGGVW